VKLILYGDMARRFGRVHISDADSPDKAIKALYANSPAALQYFVDRAHQPFRVFVGDSGVSVGLQDVYANAPGATVRIVPAILGAKSAGVGQIIMGAVLVVAGFVAAAYFGQTWGVSMMKAGGMLMLGGVAQLLFAVPLPGTPKENDASRPSYLFSGPVNTVAQGQRVPVGYGRLRVGSAVINAGMKSNDYGNAGGGPGSGSSGGGGGGVDGDRCVVYGTLVLTNRGYRNSEDIKIGTLLWTQHENTQKWGYHFVEDVVHSSAECGRVTLKDGRIIECSTNHQFLVWDEGFQAYRWCEARNLEEGNILEGSEPGIINSYHEIGVRDVIKLQVGDAHTYITNGVLSHNVKTWNRYD